MYIPAPVYGTSSLFWVDSQGATSLIGFEGQELSRPSLSPDGKRLAFDNHSGLLDDHDIWVYDLATSARTRLTTEGHNAAPLWTTDGQKVTYAARLHVEEGRHAIFWQSADGGGEAELLLEREYDLYPVSWSPDGKTLTFVEYNPIMKKNDIVCLR